MNNGATNEPIPSLAEALTVLEADTAADNVGYRKLVITAMTDAETEIRRLRARIAELEANAAITFGTLEQPTPDEPAVITHGHSPNAPPHNE